MGGGASSLPEDTQAALSDETRAAIESLSEDAKREIVTIAGMMELAPQQSRSPRRERRRLPSKRRMRPYSKEAAGAATSGGDRACRRREECGPRRAGGGEGGV